MFKFIKKMFKYMFLFFIAMYLIGTYVEMTETPEQAEYRKEKQIQEEKNDDAEEILECSGYVSKLQQLTHLEYGILEASAIWYAAAEKVAPNIDHKKYISHGIEHAIHTAKNSTPDVAVENIKQCLEKVNSFAAKYKNEYKQK